MAGIKKIKCIRCQKQFDSYEILIKHFKRDHKDFIDTTAFKWILNNSNRKRYERVETERDITRQVVASETATRLKKERKNPKVDVIQDPIVEDNSDDIKVVKENKPKGKLKGLLDSNKNSDEANQE